MTATVAATHTGSRFLGIDDIERVTAIDRAHTGRSRRRFFEKRFAAAAAKPDDFVHVGVLRAGVLRGFILAHLERGEFGRGDAVGVFDAIGVEPEDREHGVGQSLMDELAAAMRKKGVRTLHSQANWTQHGILRFLDASGFALCGRLVLERAVSEPLAEDMEDV